MKVSIFFSEISGFGGRRYERGGRNVDGRNFAKFRLKSAKKSPKNLCRRKIGEIFKKNSRTLQFIGEFSVCIADSFSDFSENFPIFPTSPARAQVTKSDHDLQAKVVFFSLAQKSWI